MNTPRKIWTEEEDQTITDIILNRKIKKWSQVAKIMEAEYNIPGRTGKQCRERWHNQLDPTIKSDKWSQRQEQLLYKYHNVYGNKWAKIAVHLTGRTDNCVKNHFYSNLRKALRRINTFIAHKAVVGEFRQIRPSVLPKIIAAAEERFAVGRNQASLPVELVDRCIRVKNSLANYCNKQELEPQEAIELAQLISEITQLGQIFKNSKTLNDAKQRQIKLETMEAEIPQMPDLSNLVQPVAKAPAIEPKLILKPLFSLQPINTRNDSIITQMSATPASLNAADLDDEDSGSMDQPIAMDPKALLGMELDSPTLPMLRLRKKATSQFTAQQITTPCRQQVSGQELDPNDAVIRLLNHEDCPAQDEGGFA